MGIRDKASKIDFGSLPGMNATPAAPASDDVKRPKTAPGLMMAQAADQRSELLRENEGLREKVASLSQQAAELGPLSQQLDQARARLKEWEGVKAVRLIDTAQITRSRWANRHDLNFSGPDFEQLLKELEQAGGNVQPVKVRPTGTDAAGQPRYELVYGHRRHEGCRRLGLPVLALVDELDDRALFLEMDRENRARKDLSAWEQGVSYRRALNEGLYPSNAKLAEALGLDLTYVGRTLALGDLPAEVVGAFSSPMELQFRWAAPLREAIQTAREAVIARARELSSLAPKAAAKFVFEELVKAAGQGGSTVLPPQVEIKFDGAKVATVKVGAKGLLGVGFEPGLVPASRLAELEALLKTFLAKGRSGD
ncbi:ParB/RepB/Spo0J family partition protein [Zoogloea sp.]|uniref:ParB/RepB/Spo0J family partition protein n=1 Tax=Zoogloea sp. TaxID=49181 RepID=UPI00321FA274